MLKDHCRGRQLSLVARQTDRPETGKRPFAQCLSETSKVAPGVWPPAKSQADVNYTN